MLKADKTSQKPKSIPVTQEEWQKHLEDLAKTKPMTWEEAKKEFGVR